MQDLVGNTAVKDSTLNYLDSDLYSIGAIASHITGCIDQLTEMNLAVLDSDETNKVRPGRHLRWDEVESLKYVCS